MKKSKPAGYQDAITELQQLVQLLQQEEVDIDQLTDTVKRAKILIEYCQDRLRQVETELGDFLQ